MITLDVVGPRRSRWTQPFADLVAPAPSSDWYRQVAHRRVFVYDRIRPYLTRLALTAVVATGYLALPSVAWWAWALLALPVTQGVLEVRLEPLVRATNVRDGARAPVAGLDAALSGVARGAYERRWLNATGILGSIAAAATVLGVAFGTTAGASTGWVKVATFLAGILYATSACSGPLLESTTYSALSRGGTAMRRLRWAAWPALVVLAAAVVALSNAVGAWPATAVPYAYLACGAAAYLGLRTREHDRAVGAGGLVAQHAQDEAASRLARGLHDVVSPRVRLLERLMTVEEIDPADAVRLAAFVEDFKYLHAKARDGLSIDESLLPDLRTTVRQACGPRGVQVDLDVDLLVGAPDGEPRRAPDRVPHKVNKDFARDVVSTLTLNAVDAYDDAGTPRRARTLRVAVRMVDGDVVVAVTDALDLVPEDVWQNPRGNLRNVRSTVTDRGGALRQVLSPSGGKTIEARWPDTYRSLLDMEEGNR